MPVRGITDVAVLGLGTMGHGIAQTFALAGYRVHGYDDVAAARATLHDRVRTNLNAFVAAGLMHEHEIATTLTRIVAHDSLADAVSQVGFVTEAVREDLATKQALFAHLETLVQPATILASNSSSFPISQSAANMKTPSRALVTHWFNPPHVVPLVEVVPGPATSEDAILTTIDILSDIRKVPLRLRKELPGFLVNRIQVALMREIWDLLEQGVASAAEIDQAVRASIGFRLAAVGPLEVHDFGGLDIQAAVFRILAPEIRDGAELPKVIDDLVSHGHLGAKTGRGFYDYSGGQVEARRDRRDALFLTLLKLLWSPEVGATGDGLTAEAQRAQRVH